MSRFSILIGRHRIIVELESALDARSAPVGHYMGRPIWSSVTFRGMQYRFD